MADYVDNLRLREVINTFNNTNRHDKGDWCAAYLQRLENKYNCNKIDETKFNLGKSFIVNKVKTIQKIQDDFEKLTPEEKRKYDRDLEKLKNEMCEYFIKIINGRINSFKLRTSLRNPEDLDDIVQDALICVLNYINRYDEARCTSAFAYVTQLATNSIVLSLNQINERERRMVNGLEFFDNINTIDDPQDGLSGLSRFME